MGILFFIFNCLINQKEYIIPLEVVHVHHVVGFFDVSLLLTTHNCNHSRACEKNQCDQLVKVQQTLAFLGIEKTH